MAEYDKENNRFPFHTNNQSVSVCAEDNEALHELDFTFDKVLKRFPSLDPVPFYAEVERIQEMPERYRLRKLKAATDGLFANIKVCLMDEDFVHWLHAKFGIGVDRLIGTLYAVYGYYFYTGKRTANAIKKIIDGYKRQPVH